MFLLQHAQRFSAAAFTRRSSIKPHESETIMKRLMTLTILALGTLGATAALAHCPPNPSGVVDGLYHKYLGRHPDAVGLNLYVADLQRGTPVDQVEASILGSPEYFRRNGSSPDGFVVGLFRDVLGQAPCPHDMKVWLGRTLHSPDRVSVALRFLREM